MSNIKYFVLYDGLYSISLKIGFREFLFQTSEKLFYSHQSFPRKLESILGSIDYRLHTKTLT